MYPHYQADPAIAARMRERALASLLPSEVVGGTRQAVMRKTRTAEIPGNIDLSNRPKIQNPDGSYSTESSFSVNIDGKEVLLPSIVDGKRLSTQESVNHYKKTGQHLGVFDTVGEANKAAENIHNRFTSQRTPLSFSHEERAVPEDRVRYALKMMESSGGTNAVPRYEPKYHKKMLESYENRKWIPTPAQRRIISERGFDEATKIFSTSLGEYQILPETAYRYTSFVGDPEDLAKPEIAEGVLSELLTRFHREGKGNLKEAIHQYNQGPEYFDKFMSYLDEEN